MPAAASLLNTHLETLVLIAYACAMGGLVWNVLLLKPWMRTSAAARRLMRRPMLLLRWGALAVGVLQLAVLATHAWLVAETFQQSPFSNYFYTVACQAGLSRAALALALAAASVWAERWPKRLLPWGLLCVLTALLAASGAWLTHAVARSDDRPFLMSLTALHQLSAAVWLGGVLQLGILWPLIRREPDLRGFWPDLVKRFAWATGPAMLCVVATSVLLARDYIGTWQGLVGTDYGAMLLVKMALLVAALGFAALSFTATRRRTASSAGDVFQRVPHYVEAEALLLIAILIVAVSLSSQPPAIDLTDSPATWAELYEVFRLKVPRLSSPSYAEVVAAFSGGVSADEGMTANVGNYWSDYNHNVSGVFLVIMALLALGAQAGWVSWARHWPLGFVVLSVFTLLRSDAEGSWPFGEMGFWEGLLSNEEILLHRLGALISCGLGVIEWRARVYGNAHGFLPYVTPLLCAAGGLLLLGHVHGGFQPKEEFLVQITHNVIGLLAVAMACARWIELRLTPPDGRLAGFVFGSAMLLVGLILLFYRETPMA